MMILVSAGLMFVSPKPDFIYDSKMQALGVKNEAGELEIYAKRISGFMKNYWANWFGQADAVVRKESVMLSAALPSRLTQRSQEADLICGSEILSKEELDKYGAILVFLKGGGCRLVYDKSERFKFK